MSTATAVRPAPAAKKVKAPAETLIVIDNNASLKALIDRHRSVCGRMAPLTREKKSIEKQLRRHIVRRGSAGVGALVWDGKVVARLSKVNNTNLDRESLKARHPRIYQRYTSIVSTFRLKVD